MKFAVYDCLVFAFAFLQTLKHIRDIIPKRIALIHAKLSIFSVDNDTVILSSISV